MRRILPFLLFLALPAHAEQRVTTYSLTSGTGFVINTSGNIVTNNHVVRECKSISILTPKGEKEAVLVANRCRHGPRRAPGGLYTGSRRPLRPKSKSKQSADDELVG